MQLTKEQQQAFAQRMNDELEKIIMSWNTELREWYPHAIKALDFANLRTVNVPAAMYPRLFEQTPHGLNLNVVAALVNNLELRLPSQMGMSAKEWAHVIDLNATVGRYWQGFVGPVQAAVQKEFEIMAGKPKLVMMGEA